MKLKYLLLFSFVAICLFFVKSVFAKDQFRIDTSIEYKVAENGTMHVTHDVVLTNLSDEYYVKNYLLTLEDINPQNVRAVEDGVEMPIDKSSEGSTVSLKIEFSDSVLGKDQSRHFRIEFDEDSFVTKTGEVWEIAIPKVSDASTYNLYNVNLLVPVGFGQEAYISPKPYSSKKDNAFYQYHFTKDQVEAAGISAGFGEFQVFAFNLNYHLVNSLGNVARSEIALPPDTYYQRVYYENLEPRPSDIKVDPDGNWIASYDLSPGQKLDIAATGSVQLFSEPRDDIPKISEDVLRQNLKASTYWQTGDPEIVRLAQSLKTPEAIYNYVVNTLSYDYGQVSPNVQRKGAVDALNSPQKAICMDFTDLFIALSRAAGIPAREINGFAYTENPAIEPLSLVADVLHAWPEYWDSARSVWVPVDPTWGNTTGGVDFFNKLDLRHFAFVIHGEDVTTPYPAGSYKLGTNPEKDVFVNFGDLPENRNKKTDIYAEVLDKIPFFPPRVKLTIKNSGDSAVYNINTSVYFDDKLERKDTVDTLLPFENKVVEFRIPYSFLALNTPNNIKVYAGKSYLQVPTDKSRLVIYNLVAVIVIITFIVLFASTRGKRVNIFDGIPFRKNKSNKE